MSEVTYCGYVAIVGRPNVGKSTLLNSLLKQKVCIVSRKAQTTRHKILGVKTNGEYQIVYVDTPGIHLKAKREMNKMMNRAAESALADVELVFFMVDVRRWTDEDELVLSKLEKLNIPVFLLINKVDLIKDKATLLPKMEALSQKMAFKDVLPISAKKHDNVAALEKIVESLLPESPHFFPEDQITDRDRAFMISETVREKILLLTSQEVPYSATVAVESIKQEKSVLHIYAVIWLERASQKSIVIGKGGERLKMIGQQARLDLQKQFQQKIFLKLWVKVKEGWVDDQRSLREFGLDQG